MPGAWNRSPTLTKRGEKRYSVGYSDETGVTRTKGGFRSQRGEAGTNQWIAKYRVAEAQGRSALKAFLDREVRGIDPDSESIPSVDQAMGEWLYLSRPEARGGLRASTYQSYIQTYQKHVRPELGSMPITKLAKPAPAARLRDGLTARGVGQDTVRRALAVLSSMLSWAVEREMLDANGVMLLASRARQSSRRASTREASAGSHLRRQPGWALSPEAAAAMVQALLEGPSRFPWVPFRDATYAVVQYLSGGRNQDVWPLRFGSLAGTTLWFDEFTTVGGLSSSGKVGHSVRRIEVGGEMIRWFEKWRDTAASHGLPAGASDFLFPGTADLGHLTEGQIKNWRAGRFKRARQRAANSDPALGYLALATPYAFRRGHISVRLRRGDDPAVVARDCATSVEMLFRHYWADTQDRDATLAPLDEQFAAALARVGRAC